MIAALGLLLGLSIVGAIIAIWLWHVGEKGAPPEAIGRERPDG